MILQANLKGFQGSHNKLMVTDKSGFIGTSNWSEDYYSTTAGVTFIFTPFKKAGKHFSTDLRTQLEEIFFRDYNSQLAQNITFSQ